MYTELEKIKEKKEKKIKEYYKSYFGGEGLDSIMIQSLKNKTQTKKRKLRANPQHQTRTHKQVKSAALQQPQTERQVMEKTDDKIKELEANTN
jgi:hypothetical protein